MRSDWLNIIKSFSKLNVLIVGDVMIDEYLSGKVDRISPEAPVPVVDVKARVHRLGGASNVALNCKALGANPILCGLIGEDINAKTYLKLLNDSGLSSEATVFSSSRKTSCKTRIISNNQQMIRVDVEDKHDLNKEEQNALKAMLKKHITSNLDLVIIEDYDKGCLNQEVITYIEKLCSNHNVFVSVDPKKQNFSYYKNVSLFKPNLKELQEGVNTHIDPTSNTSISAAINLLNSEVQKANHLITLSKHGVFYRTKAGEAGGYPAELRNISDVSGAGDTVISVASLAMQSGCSLAEASWLANLAGGFVCEKPEVVPIKSEELINEIARLEYGK